MHSRREVEQALALVASGLNYSEVARRTGLARATIRRWAHDGPNEKAEARRRGTCFRCAGYRFPVPEATEFAYAYLLGLYLGDGNITTQPKGVFRLRIYLDRGYPVIVEEAAAAMSIVMPASTVTVARARRAGMDIPGSYSRHWPCLIPQHGRRMKHEREIVLEPWQREILDRYPWRFLRGLIHSDGCRSLNTIEHPRKTYRYPRYTFSNRSDDIRGLFCEYCDKVGVQWRQMNRWNISVARRESVALMDRYIGPKR